MALLDFLRPSTGVLNQPQSFGQQFGGFLQNNPAMLIQLGSAIGSNAGFPNALAAIGQTVPQAMALDRQSAQQRKRQAAMTRALKLHGKGLTPEMIDFYEAYPEAGFEYIADAIAPKPIEYGFEEVDGTLLRTNKNAGTAEPVYTGAQDDNFRPLTADEMTQWGITGGSWAMGPDSKPIQIQDTRLLTPQEMDQRIELAQAGRSNVSVDLGGKLTEGQSKDVGYYSRGTMANRDLAPIEKELTDLGGSFASDGGRLGNYFKTPQYQQAERAGREFLAVILRKDTGAAVTPAEFELYGPMYLPIPGDAPEVLAAKRAARDNALRAIKIGLGTARPLAEQIDAELGIGSPAGEAAAPQQLPQPGHSATTAPPGIPQEEWDVMTPEERALWQN